MFFAYYFNNGVPVHCVVELLNDLPHGLELFEVHGEVHFMLFEVDEVLIGLPQSLDWFLAPPVVEVDVLNRNPTIRSVGQNLKKKKLKKTVDLTGAYPAF